MAASGTGKAAGATAATAGTEGTDEEGTETVAAAAAAAAAEVVVVVVAVLTSEAKIVADDLRSSTPTGGPLGSGGAAERADAGAASLLRAELGLARSVVINRKPCSPPSDSVSKLALLPWPL